VIWAKKYLPRKNKGFRQPILNSRIFIEYYYQLESLTMSLKKVGKPQNALFIRFSPINANSQRTPAECRFDRDRYRFFVRAIALHVEKCDRLFLGRRSLVDEVISVFWECDRWLILWLVRSLLGFWECDRRLIW
jgi:hypothetical protein